MQELDFIITCPYDKTHRIRKKRLPFHLVKCSRNHPSKTKKICPFDVTHVVDAAEFEKHILTCPTSGNVRNSIYCLSSRQDCGTVPLEVVINRQLPFTTENWDQENSETYNPLRNIEERQVLQSLIVASKSKKKKFRQKERLRFLSLNSRVSFKPNNSVQRDEIPQRLYSSQNLTKILCDTVVQRLKNLSLYSIDSLLETIGMQALSILDRTPECNKTNVSKYVEYELVKRFKSTVFLSLKTITASE